MAFRIVQGVVYIRVCRIVQESLEVGHILFHIGSQIANDAILIENGSVVLRIGDFKEIGVFAGADHQVELILLAAHGRDLEIQGHVEFFVQILHHGVVAVIAVIGIIVREQPKGHGHMLTQVIFCQGRANHGQRHHQRKDSGQQLFRHFLVLPSLCLRGKLIPFYMFIVSENAFYFL